MEFPRPPEVVTAWIDGQSNALANSGCPQKREEVYLAGTEPQDRCPLYGGEPYPPGAPVERMAPATVWF